MIKLENLKHLGPKGEGYFCIVKLYTDEDSNKNYALKELKKVHYQNEEYRYRLTREIKLLDELQECDNIISLIDHGNDKTKEKLWYLMPHAKYNLFEYIKKNNATLDLQTRFEIAGHIINAIKYAHEREILHRDISPNNALVFFRNGKPIIKVCDFGLGKDKESLSYYTSSSVSGYGQILYVAPEQRLKLKDSTVKSDIYSLGKLIYFIFTGKDPDNLKPFELSTLVVKATEEDPIDRFESVIELETHFNALKELHLNQNIPFEYVTLKEVLASEDDISILELHQLLIKGNYIDHVYYDYIDPVNSYFLKGNNLPLYYKAIGNGIRDFVKTYSDKLNECYQTVRWPFSSMSTFGKVLKKIIQTVSDDETKLICLKQLWYLAFESDQWDVQKDVKEVYSEKYISKNIETQLAEYIIQAETKVEMNHFNSLILPRVIKVSIIKANDLAVKKSEERKRQNDIDADW